MKKFKKKNLAYLGTRLPNSMIVAAKRAAKREHLYLADYVLQAIELRLERSYDSDSMDKLKERFYETANENK